MKAVLPSLAVQLSTAAHHMGREFIWISELAITFNWKKLQFSIPDVNKVFRLHVDILTPMHYRKTVSCLSLPRPQCLVPSCELRSPLTALLHRSLAEPRTNHFVPDQHGLHRTAKWAFMLRKTSDPLSLTNHKETTTGSHPLGNMHTVKWWQIQHKQQTWTLTSY